MKETEQTEGLNIFQHGLSVWKYTRKLLDGNTTDMRKLPNWYLENRDLILENCYDRKTIKQYTIFHDLGKPFCLTYDDNGKKHFPNHAAISEKIWIESGFDPNIGELIGLDMMFHAETPEQILSRNLDKRILCTLLLSALAELYSNAEMFGGISSESFCIKYKRLNKRAKRILDLMNS